MKQKLLAFIASSILFSVNAQAGVDASDFTVVAYKVDSTREPKNLFDGINDAVRNPVVGPIIVIGAYYLQVPPETIAAAAASAAVAPKLDPFASSAGEDTSYRFSVPQGYLVCAANFRLNSVVPAFGKRASLVAASGDSSVVSVYTWTPKRGVGEGRSWVDMEVGILAVKANKVKQYRDKCADPDRVRSYFSCRGQDCPLANGAWLKDAWARGDDVAEVTAAVDVVLRLILIGK